MTRFVRSPPVMRMHLLIYSNQPLNKMFSPIREINKKRGRRPASIDSLIMQLGGRE